MSDEIRIAISTDARGFGPNATLLASILRRTSSSVQEVRPLKVEFIAAGEEVTGRFPGNVGPLLKLKGMREADVSKTPKPESNHRFSAKWTFVTVLSTSVIVLSGIRAYVTVSKYPVIKMAENIDFVTVLGES